MRRKARRQPARPWRPFHLRWSLAVALALLVGSGFGFVLGASDTSRGDAASARSRLTVAGGRMAPAAASRVIDRTFVCTLSYGEVDVVASPRGATEVVGGRFTSSGYARMTSGQHGDPHSDLVVVARPGLRNPNMRFPAAVYANARRCVASRTAVPLRRTGLPGPAVTFSSHTECNVRGRVLVRVRAVVNAGGTWRRVATAFVGARGRLVEADLAVRGQNKRTPLAFVRLRRTGQTQLWGSAGCV